MFKHLYLLFIIAILNPLSLQASDWEPTSSYSIIIAKSRETLHILLGNNPKYGTKTQENPCQESYAHKLSEELEKESISSFNIINHYNSNQPVVVSIDENLYKFEEEEPILPRIQFNVIDNVISEGVLVNVSQEWNIILIQVSRTSVGDVSYTSHINVNIPRIDNENIPCHIPENSTVFVSSTFTILDKGNYILMRNLKIVGIILGIIIITILYIKKKSKKH